MQSHVIAEASSLNAVANAAAAAAAAAGRKRTREQANDELLMVFRVAPSLFMN